MSTIPVRRLGATLAGLAALAGVATPVAEGAGDRTSDSTSYVPAARQPGPAPKAVAGYYPVAYPKRQVLPSARVDVNANTVTLPLREGRLADGRRVWYVITEASDRRIAHQLGVTYAAKLGNAPAAATRTGHWARHGLVFDAGTVDFAVDRTVVRGDGEHAFPPKVAQPGSIGDSDYSPLVRVGSVVLNATMVAFNVSANTIEYPRGGVDHDRVLDRVTAISPRRGLVTFAMSEGTASGHAVLFVSLDSSSPLVSALETTTFAPRLAGLPAGGANHRGSSVSANYIVANGPTGAANPQAQGLDHALGDHGGQVLDILATVPGVVAGRDYSPMWSLYVAAWSQAAIDAGYRSVLHSELDALGMSARGFLTAPDGSALIPSGLISNCPVLATF